LSQKVQVIVSVGGGTLVTAKSLEIAQQSGIIVYLRAPVRVLYERVIFSPKQRPVIDVPDTEHLFAQTFEQRRFYYEQADITVDTDAQGVKQVVHNILEALRGINP
jgi:shikimate kinase